MAEIQIVAQPLLIVRALLDRNVVLCQPRLVETGQIRGDNEHVMISVAVYPVINDVRRLRNASKIMNFFSKTTNYGK